MDHQDCRSIPGRGPCADDRHSSCGRKFCELFSDSELLGGSQAVGREDPVGIECRNGEGK